MDNNKTIIFKSPIFTQFNAEDCLWTEAAQSPAAIASLKGLTSICPVAAKNPFFDQGLLIEAIGQLLSKCGIPTSSEVDESEGTACLCFNPLVAKAERIGLYAYCTFLWVEQDVYLSRMPYCVETFQIPTWQAAKTGACWDLNQVIFDLGILIGVFKDAYFSVNKFDEQKEIYQNDR